MNTSSSYLKAQKRPAFASLRDLVRSLPRHYRFGNAESGRSTRTPSWMQLELDQLQYLIRELESGFHRVHPATLQAIQQHVLEVKRTEQGNQRMHDARTPFEDRYHDDRVLDVDAMEVLPRCWVTDKTARPKMSPEVHALLTTESDPVRYAWHYQMWRYQNRLVTLVDGRWAYRLDASRAQPLCGVLGIVRLSVVELRVNECPAVEQIWITGSVQCSECGGMHRHPVSVPQSVSRTASELSQVCQHCQSTALESIVYGRGSYQVTDWHCVNCGWYPKSALTTLPLSVVESNLLAVPARCTDLSTSECLQTQLDVVMGDEAGTVVEGMGEDESDELTGYEVETDPLVTEDELVSDDQEETTAHSEEFEVVATDLPAYDELLVSLQGGFWKNRHAKYLRGYLLDMTIRCGGLRDRHARRDLVWAVASVLSESCESMGKLEQRQLGRWILKQSDEALQKLLPEVELTTELTTGQSVRCVPPMDGWLQQWTMACLRKRRSYLYRKAAARRFAPFFGVYQQTFLRAVGSI